MAPLPDQPANEESEWLTEVGLRVRMARFRRRISQTDMARRAGVSRVTLGAIERAEHAATAPTYRRIAAALGLPIGELLGEVAPISGRGRVSGRPRDG